MTSSTAVVSDLARMGTIFRKPNLFPDVDSKVRNALDFLDLFYSTRFLYRRVLLWVGQQTANVRSYNVVK